MIYNGIDLLIDENGDIIISNGDVIKAKDSKAFEQNIKNRILSIKGEIPLHKCIGVNLDLLEGMPNTKETANIGAEQINSSISCDFDEYANEVKIRYFPVDYDKIMYILSANVYDSDASSYNNIVQTINIVL